ncbi:MAG: hypothetical protein QOI36_835, partial [Pseudonocardiales bacterium]|nr:hypothetical protein [Pseudonocardiales bacterium]
MTSQDGGHWPTDVEPETDQVDAATDDVNGAQRS